MRQLTLVIPEDVHAQLILAAGAAGQTVEQFAVTVLRLGLPFPSAAPVPPSSQFAPLASLQSASSRDHNLDW